MSNNNSIMDLIYRPQRNAPFVPLETFAGLFPIGKISMIVSKAGVGKSWLVRYCMNQASIGQDIYGNDAEVCSSLCFSGEDDEEDLKHRDRLTGNCAWDESKIKYLTTDELIKAGIIPNLIGEGSDKFRAKVQEAVTKVGAKAVFVDSLVSFNGGDENSGKDMAELFGWASSFAQSNKIAVVLSHHLRKTFKFKGKAIDIDIDEVAGHSSMIRKAKTVYFMAKTAVPSTSATTKGYVTQLLVKQLRNASLVRDPFIFTLTTREFDTNEISTEITDQSYTKFEVRDADGSEIIANNQETRDKMKQAETAIKSLLTNGDETTNHIYVYVQSQCNIDIKERSIRDVLAKMVKDGIIAKRDEKRGKYDVYYRLPVSNPGGGTSRS